MCVKSKRKWDIVKFKTSKLPIGASKTKLKPFLANVSLFVPFENTRKLGFTVFSGGVKLKHWLKMVNKEYSRL